MWIASEKTERGSRTPEKSARPGARAANRGRPLPRRKLIGGDGGFDQRSGRGFGFVDLHLVAKVAPGVESALKRADASDALLLQEQRHTGAGGFVGSSTVEDDFAIVGKAIAVFL